MRLIRPGFLRFGISAIAAVLCAIFLAGCPGGGGGGGGTVTPPTTNPVHTTFSNSPAYVAQAGQSFFASVTISETRGDEIQFNKMYTYRTFADNYNSGKTNYYYNSGPSVVYGWMFAPAGTISGDIRDAIIQNSSSASGWTPQRLQAYERRTLTAQVMLGTQNQTKPAGFTGIFIPFSEYSQWVMQGQKGVRYWVSLEGFDAKLNETYNVHIPLEIQFPFSITTDPYDSTNNTGTDTNTDPYDPFG